MNHLTNSNIFHSTKLQQHLMKNKHIHQQRNNRDRTLVDHCWIINALKIKTGIPLCCKYLFCLSHAGYLGICILFPAVSKAIDYTKETSVPLLKDQWLKFLWWCLWEGAILTESPKSCIQTGFWRACSPIKGWCQDLLVQYHCVGSCGCMPVLWNIEVYMPEVVRSNTGPTPAVPTTPAK